MMLSKFWLPRENVLFLSNMTSIYATVIHRKVSLNSLCMYICFLTTEIVEKVKFNQEKDPLRPIVEDTDLDENTFSHFAALAEKCWAENPDEHRMSEQCLEYYKKLEGESEFLNLFSQIRSIVYL